ncbi:MAG: tetratricopeptide repeat protein, partial [Pacificimonas sp.]
MPSIGAKPLATSTAIIAATLALSACQQSAKSPVASLNDAVATRAYLEKAAARQAQAMDQFAIEAEAARLAGNLPVAIELGEQAVALDMNDAAARRTLAQAYFAAGRFQSAAQAYSDLLAMNPKADTHKFGAALTALANNDRLQAHALLSELANDPARAGDVGLAYVLLGDMKRGTAMLESAVRSGTSTAQTRQNLALAQAMSGDWNAARVTAAVDLTPAAVEARVAEWAALAVSEDPAWRTASLMKINPAHVDVGRPVQLAWVAPSGDQNVQTATAPAAVVDVPVVAVVDRDVASEGEAVAVVTPVVVAEVSAPEPETPVAAAADVKPARLVKASALSVAPRAPDFAPKKDTKVEPEPEKAKAEAKPEPKSEPLAAVSLPDAGNGKGNW